MPLSIVGRVFLKFEICILSHSKPVNQSKTNTFFRDELDQEVSKIFALVLNKPDKWFVTKVLMSECLFLLIYVNVGTLKLICFYFIFQKYTRHIHQGISCKYIFIL